MCPDPELNQRPFDLRDGAPTNWTTPPEQEALFFFLRFYLFIFREGKEGRKGEKHQCVVASHMPPPLRLGTWPATQAYALTGNQTWRPFGSQAGTQSTEPHQPGQEALFKCHSQPHPLEKIPFNTLVHSVLDAVCVFLNTELIWRMLFCTLIFLFGNTTWSMLSYP